MKDHYDQILLAAEQRAENILINMIRESGTQDYGGVRNPSNGLINPGDSVNCLVTLAAVYLNEDSKLFRNQQIFQDICAVLDYVERVQRPDGTFDLITTNFYSAPDTAFCMHNLIVVYRMIKRYCTDNEKKLLKPKLLHVINESARGIRDGGFHTPNHRWVEASALMQAYNIINDSSLKEMALRYLNEGIDCDENGEYAERSAAIYNAVNNEAMIILAEETGEETYLDHVKRNLNMMFTYIDPDGSLFTQNSIRQDKGVKYFPDRYYPIYLYMVHRYGDGKYAAMLQHIMQLSKTHKCPVPNCLHLFMLNPQLKQIKLEPKPIPQSFDFFSPKSGIIRVRRDDISFTLLKENSNFLTFQAGSLSCTVKMCASFFGAAQFRAQQIERLSDRYILSFRSNGWYRMPFDNPPETSDWWKMDHQKRRKVKNINLDMKAVVREIDEGITLNVDIFGCDRVPFKMEFCLPPGSVIHGDNFVTIGKAGDSLVVRSGDIKASYGSDTISIGSAFASHWYTQDMRGSELQSVQNFTIYFTDYTTVSRTITIKKVSR